MINQFNLATNCIIIPTTSLGRFDTSRNRSILLIMSPFIDNNKDYSFEFCILHRRGELQVLLGHEWQINVNPGVDEPRVLGLRDQIAR